MWEKASKGFARDFSIYPSGPRIRCLTGMEAWSELALKDLPAIKMTWGTCTGFRRVVPIWGASWNGIRMSEAGTVPVTVPDMMWTAGCWTTRRKRKNTTGPRGRRHFRFHFHSLSTFVLNVCQKLPCPVVYRYMIQ